MRSLSLLLGVICLGIGLPADASPLSDSLANHLAKHADEPGRVIVKFRDGSGVGIHHSRVVVENPKPDPQYTADVALLQRLLDRSGFDAKPLFSQSREFLRDLRLRHSQKPGRLADLTLYAAFDSPNTADVNAVATLVNAANALSVVDIAYLETPTSAHWPSAVTKLAPAGITPPLTQYQDYLKAAPVGIGARDAWNVPGGTGSSVRVLVYDNAFRATHEDLPVIASDNGMNPTGEAHGTAAIGVIAAKRNGIGIDGIAYGAQTIFRRAAAFQESHADTIIEMGGLLQPGDVVLFEVGRKVNSLGFQCPCNPTQANQMPMEFYPAEFDAIQYLVAAGISVVEAAGNGCVDFDDPMFDGQFDGSFDSGAILVAAGGTGLGAMCYTSHGARMDLFAQGEQVASLSYLRDGEVPLFDKGPDRLYVPNFGGTSAAAAIVAGAVASVQGQRKATGYPPLPPSTTRDLLVSSGTKQAMDMDRLIGRMPDLGNITF